MSFLLDALRKSERQKHLGEVPTIHGADPRGGRAMLRRRSGPLALVLLPAFLVLIWFGAKQFERTDEPQDPAPFERSRTAVNSKADPAAKQDVPRPQAPVPAPDVETAPERPGPGARHSDAGRTPVEIFAGPPVEIGQAQKTPNPSSSSPESEAPPAESEPQPYSAPEPGPIRMWELPRSVRDDLPEFRISVLVYAERPEERFILLNGQRQIEGDAYQPGLVLEEIRRDGVVYSYRHYRFLVSR